MGLDFLEQEPSSSTRAPLNTFKYVMSIGAIIKKKCTKTRDGNVTVKNAELQSLYQIKLDISRVSCSKKKCIFGCPQVDTGPHRVLENTSAQVAKDFHFYIAVEARVTVTISTCGHRFLLKQPSFYNRPSN